MSLRLIIVGGGYKSRFSFTVCATGGFIEVTKHRVLTLAEISVKEVSTGGHSTSFRCRRREPRFTVDHLRRHEPAGSFLAGLPDTERRSHVFNTQTGAS